MALHMPLGLLLILLGQVVKVYRVVSSLSLHLVMMRDGFLMLFWPHFEQVSHRFPLSDI